MRDCSRLRSQPGCSSSPERRASAAGSSERHAGVAQAAAPLAAPGESVSTASGWATKNLKGSVRLEGQVPRAVASKSAHRVGHHPRASEIKLSFAFPLRDKAGLDRLIAQQAKTHRYLSRPRSTRGSRLRSRR